MSYDYLPFGTRLKAHLIQSAQQLAAAQAVCYEAIQQVTPLTILTQEKYFNPEAQRIAGIMTRQVAFFEDKAEKFGAEIERINALIAAVDPSGMSDEPDSDEIIDGEDAGPEIDLEENIPV